MSGVLAVADPLRRRPIGPVLDAMLAAVHLRPWHTSATVVDEGRGIGIAQTGIGVFDRDRPPVTGEGGVAVAMAGVLFEPERQWRDLGRQERYASRTDAELLLQLYLHEGAKLCARLNGEFVAVIWDARQDEVLVINDRFGFYPTYLAVADGRLLVAPSQKAILSTPDFPRRLDETALAQYMRFQCLLGERTFFSDIELLPPASVFRFQLCDGSRTREPYWHPSAIRAAPPLRFEEAVQEAGRLLAVAVTRQVGQGRRSGLYLTGGLDSRLLLGLLARAGRKVPTITFGQRRSRDVVYARYLARIAGSDHHWFSLDDGAWVAEWSRLHTQLTEGLHSWIHAHGVSTLPEARRLCDVAITGIDGGTVVGGWLNKLDPGDVSDNLDLITARQFQRFNQRYTWPGLNEGEAYALFAPPYATALRDRAYASLRDELARYGDCRPEVREELCYIRNHCFRLTLGFVTMLRSHVEVTSPYFDADLFAFIYSLPPSLRGYKLIERALLQAHASALCYVPDARTEHLPTTQESLRSMHSFLHRALRPVRARLPVFRPLHPLYADYEGYLRSDLRAWAEDILFGARTVERGIFNRQFVRSLWERMQSRLEPDIVGKLAPIMSYELMLRELVDR